MEIQLDPQAVNLAKAIRQSESGGDSTAKGKSGEYGAYQFTEPTWNTASQKFLGQQIPLAQSTSQQQNEVAYKQIKEWKDKGHNVGEIASMWNAGENKPKAYLEGNIGVNKYGVKFDTPAYAKSVATAYQTIKNGGQVQMDVNNPSSIAGTQVEEPKPKQEGYQPTFQTNPNEGYGTTIAKTLGNIPNSALNFGKGIVDFLNPVNTIKSLSKIPGEFSALVKESGGIGNAIKGTLGEIPSSAYNSLMPQFGKELIKGDVEGAAKTITEDPVGQIAPVLMVAKGAAEKLGKGAEFDSAVSKVTSPITKPIEGVVKKVGEGLGAIRNFTVGQIAGVQGSTVGETIKNPKFFTPENIKNANDARTALSKEIEFKLNERIAQLGETGKQYDPIRTNQTPIKVDPNFLLDQIQKQTGLTLDKTGQFEKTTTSRISSTADINKIQQFFDDWQKTFESGNMTPEEFLTMRDRLAGLAKYEGGVGKSTSLENMNKGIRANLNAEYRPKIKGLEEIDSDYASQLSELKNLKAGILDKNNQLTPGAITKIANATGKGKTDFLAKIEEISPGITERIGIVKALEDWNSAGGIKVGVYSRTGIVGGGFMAGGPMGAIIASILTSPEIVVPILRIYGNLNGIGNSVINKIINKLKTATSLTSPELKILIGAISAAENNKSLMPTSALNPEPQ